MQSFFLQTLGRGGESLSTETLQVLCKPSSLYTASTVASVPFLKKRANGKTDVSKSLGASQTTEKDTLSACHSSCLSFHRGL